MREPDHTLVAPAAAAASQSHDDEAGAAIDGMAGAASGSHDDEAAAGASAASPKEMMADDADGKSRSE